MEDRRSGTFMLLECVLFKSSLPVEANTSFFILFFILTWGHFSEGKEGSEERKEKNINMREKYWLVASCTCPDWGSFVPCWGNEFATYVCALIGNLNPQPFGFGMMLQSMEPHLAFLTRMKVVARSMCLKGDELQLALCFHGFCIYGLKIFSKKVTSLVCIIYLSLRWLCLYWTCTDFFLLLFPKQYSITTIYKALTLH